ncbi:hypothetical protein NJB1907f44_20180 [Mycobacterium marinum]|nr:hypothetical protein NJB1907E90_10170 [Mycobacterium marinum]GJO07986.1 hypothetical protein NJB1907f34b_35460 [Mycobacterium marinum]GJO12831.1 hypothetical protein NJB1907E11_06810 [Mycobacterium marinum]GJO17323.1 hypothetical protein NJB1728e18_12410 [Mycobacterium marinum]GJO28447.1 hypothetical protein NJB1907f22_21540 [Mycobacterium marinum]
MPHQQQRVPVTHSAHPKANRVGGTDARSNHQLGGEHRAHFAAHQMATRPALPRCEWMFDYGGRRGSSIPGPTACESNLPGEVPRLVGAQTYTRVALIDTLFR